MTNRLIYISHPCTSCGDIEENRQQARQFADKYKKQGYHVINPLEVINPESSYAEAMDISYRLLSICDAIAMCGNWKQSTGCFEEFNYALCNNKEVIYDGGMK
ncbi:MAG: DUF4406 domain-containing protein [Bacillota bacterium]|nr:DUF4406 domain-containing protein [Bacillota bacterium]